MGELLSLAEIVRRTGIDQHVLNRYVKLPENRAALMGESTHPQYPFEALNLFFRLAQEHAAGAITPKTLAARWRLDSGGQELMQAAQGELRRAQSAIGRVQSAGHSSEIAEGIELLRDLVAAQTTIALNSQSILTARDVCRLLSISPDTLRRHGPAPAYRIGRSPRWLLEEVRAWKPNG